MWVLLLTTHGYLATFSGGAGTLRVDQPHTMVFCTHLCCLGCTIHLPCPWHPPRKFPVAPGCSGGLQGKGITYREIKESKLDCFGDKRQLTREVPEEPRLHVGSPILLGSEGEGSPDPLQVYAGNEEPLPTAWLLPSRWSQAGLQTGGIQAIWSHAWRRRRRWRQQLEPGSALPPNPLAHCTRGIRAPPAPC